MTFVTPESDPAISVRAHLLVTAVSILRWGNAMFRLKVFAALLLIPVIAFVPGCGGGGDSSQTYTVTGSVSNASPGVLMQVAGPVSKSTTTDANGAYSLTGLPNGQYFITPMQEGSVFTPLSLTVTIAGANVVAPGLAAQQEETDGLSVEVLQYLDTLPDDPLTPDQVILPNGMSMAAFNAGTPSALTASAVAKDSTPPPATDPVQKKNAVIKQLIAQAQSYACGRLPTGRCTTWDQPADKSNSVIRPAQAGLTYVYGGVTTAGRSTPKDGCPQQTVGLDCSGLISLIWASVGVTAPTSTSDKEKPSAAQSIPSRWTLPADWQLQMTLVTDGTIQSGDLVAWKGHIGIAETSGTTATAHVISSTGHYAECLKNITPPRGPRTLTVADLSNPPKGQKTGGLGKPTVLRMMPTQLTDTLSLVASPAAIDPGGSVTLTAMVFVSSGGPKPTGNVNFVDQTGASLCAGVPLTQAGSATCRATINSSESTDVVTATYAGDSNYPPTSGTATISIITLTSNYFVYYFVFQNIQCGTTAQGSLVVTGGGQTFNVSASSVPAGQCTPDSPQIYNSQIGPIKIPLQHGTSYTATFTWSGGVPTGANIAYEIDEVSAAGLPIPPSPANAFSANSATPVQGQNVQTFVAPGL
jgi:hypothetical protein